MNYTKEQVSRHICTILDNQGIDLTLPIGDVKLEDLGLDSLDQAELLVEIETLYDITLERDDMVIRLDATLASVIDVVHEHLELTIQ